LPGALVDILTRASGRAFETISAFGYASLRDIRRHREIRTLSGILAGHACICLWTEIYWIRTARIRRTGNGEGDEQQNAKTLHKDSL
jgi:hypothetical protein